MRTIFVILGFLAATSSAFASMPTALARQNDRPHSHAYKRTKPPRTQHSHSRSSR